MPKPEVILIKGMKQKTCTAILQKMEEWCKTEEVSQIKKSILTIIIDYAKKNLINHMETISDTSYPDLKDLEVCNAIFQQADLPEALFMRYVIDQTRKGSDFTFFREITNKAEETLQTLSIPLIFETRTIAGSLGVFSLLTNTKIGILASVGLFAFANIIVDWRINNSLQNKLALKKIGNVKPNIEDGYDEVNKGAAHFAKSAYNYTTLFFHNNVVPWLSKQIEKNAVKQPQRN